MKLTFIAFMLLFLMSACTQPEEVKPDPPVAVQMVLRTAGADTLEVEPGIDAVSIPGEDINAIQLSWLRHPGQSDLIQYNIYRSENESGLSNFNPYAVKDIGQPGAVDTLFLDTQNLDLYKRYYYYITAIDEYDQESEPSDTVSYELWEKASGLSLNGNASVIREPDMEFQWWLGQSVYVYILRIERVITEDFHPLVYLKVIYTTEFTMPQIYRISGEWLKSTFENGSYRWRIDCASDESLGEYSNEGSESDWIAFEVNWSN